MVENEEEESKVVMGRDKRLQLLKRAIHSIDREISEDKLQKDKKLQVEREKMDCRFNHNNARKNALPHSRNMNIMNKTAVMNRTNFSFVSQ